MNQFKKVILVAIVCSVVFAILGQWIFEGGLPFLPFPLLAGFLIVFFQKETRSHKFVIKLIIGALIFGFLTPALISFRAFLMSYLFYDNSFPFLFNFSRDGLFMSLAFSLIAFLGGLLGIVIIGFYSLYRRAFERGLIFAGALLLTGFSLFVTGEKIGGTISSRIYGWPYPFLTYNIQDVIDHTIISQWIFSPGSFYHYLIFDYLLYLFILTIFFWLFKLLNKFLKTSKLNMTWALMGVIAVIAVAFTSSQSLKQSYIQNQIRKAGYCQADSDCVIAGSRCPFGCAITVNKNEAGEIIRLVNSYTSNCDYSCLAETKVICKKNKCEVSTGQTKEEINGLIWQRIKSSLENCQVSKIMQTHDLEVKAVLKTGETIKAVEPAIDQIFKIAERVEDKCGKIIMATE